MKRKIAIIAGGDSSEHDVSLRSAASIKGWLDPERYDAEIVELQGADLKTLNKITEFDYAYVTIHGTPGENGLLQGFLEMMHIPYSCCGVLAAAMTFNKYTCNHYLAPFGIKISPSILLRKGGNGEWRMVNGERPTAQKVVDEVGLPCFIKSNVGGSSFGCTKVKTLEEVEPAIEAAFREGVYKTTKRSVALPITEVVTSNEFFDYDAKYNGQVQEITPARIPDATRDAVQALTLKIYDILGCKGIIRTDYIIAPDGTIQLLEVNTTPGMTATSFIPQQVRAAGMEMRDVLSEIIDD